MERKRSIYLISIVALAVVIVKYWHLEHAIKKPFGYIQKAVVNFAKPHRDEAREQYDDQTATIERLERENDQLRRQLGITPRSARPLMSANIAAFEQTLIVSAITIDRGSDDGVREGLAVVSGGNVLLGVVREVFPHSSRVYLIDDPRVRMSVRILAADTLAELEGARHGNFALNLIARSDLVEPGARVVTSGLDGLPASLVVGAVTSVRDAPEGLFRKVEGNAAFSLAGSAVVFVIL